MNRKYCLQKKEVFRDIIILQQQHHMLLENSKSKKGHN